MKQGKGTSKYRIYSIRNIKNFRYVPTNDIVTLSIANIEQIQKNTIKRLLDDYINILLGIDEMIKNSWTFGQ